LKRGQQFVQRGIAARDKAHCKRFLDGSEAASLLTMDDDDDEGILPSSQEVGNTNYLAINVMTKIDSIAIADPDFHVICEEEPAPEPMLDPATGMPIDPMMGMGMGQPEPVSRAEIVRRSVRELWKKRRWARVTRKALLKRCISGMGCVAYLWDQDDAGPVLEHVPVKDLAVDPHVIDWRKLEWGGRCIRLSKEKARKRWPREDFAGPHHSDIPDLDTERATPKNSVKIWVYWDGETEAYVHGSTLLEKPHQNPYGKVPLIFHEGDIAPESEFSLGDYDIAIQLQVMLARLQAIINHDAENGGAILWKNSTLMNEGSQNAFANGRPTAPVDCQATGDEDVPFGFKSGTPMNPALLEAFKLASTGLDAATGVTEPMRGTITSDPKFATQVAAASAQSGRRGEQARRQYELFLDDCAMAIVELMVRFGPALIGEDENGMPDENDVLLLEAFAAVQEICALESSTAYKDPAYELQLNLQLLEKMLPFIEAGYLNPEPFIKDVLQAAGKRNVAIYFNQMSPSLIPAQAGGNAGGAPEDAGQPGGAPPATPSPPAGY
jgi:hypothetical protein